MTRFPAAAVVPSTAAKPVLHELGKIYDSFGNSDAHRTDNGPPFNSSAFGTMLKERGIEHIKTYEYRPQANPAETFMKPLGKTVKAANLEGRSVDEALNKLVQNYRSTPHSATLQSPGSMLFRSGYQSEFPRKALSQKEFEQAKEFEMRQKMERTAVLNDSNRRVSSQITVGDMVRIRDRNRKRKMDPLFKKQLYQVIEETAAGVLVRDAEGKVKRRHKDDVKLVNGAGFAQEQAPQFWTTTVWKEQLGEVPEVERQGEHSDGNDEQTDDEQEPALPVALPDNLDETVSDDLEDRVCLLYTSPSPRDRSLSRMPSSA